MRSEMPAAKDGAEGETSVDEQTCSNAFLSSTHFLY